MALIEDLREKVELDAVDQTVLRGILVDEVREAFADAEVIEEYPDDKYGPSRLILGRTKTGRPLHIQCSYPSRPIEGTENGTQLFLENNSFNERAPLNSSGVHSGQNGSRFPPVCG